MGTLRILAAGVAFAVAIAGSTPATFAGPVLATRVLVVDQAGAPVAAEIFSANEAQLVSLGHTDATGELDLKLPGATQLVARRGTATSPAVAAQEGDVRLVMPLQELVHVRAAVANTTEQRVSEDSAAAVAFDDVATARSLVANYRSHSEGGSGHQTLNGVPLDLPSGPGGSGGDQPGLPSDLIDSFNAVQADDGTITPNYHLLSPTATTRLHFTSGLGNDDTSLWKVGLSGTVAKLGYAIAAATGRDDGVLAGATYADASGARYDHSTDARHTDVSLSLSQPIGTTQLNAAGFATRKTGDDIDPTMPGAIGLGDGPGNVTTSTTGFEYIVASQTHGRDAYHLIDSRFAGGSQDDARNALLAGYAVGSVSGYKYSGSYDELSMTRSFGSAALTAKITATNTSTTGYVTDSAFASAAAIAAGQQTVGLDYEAHKGTSNYGFSFDRARRLGDFAGTSLEARLHAGATIRGTVVRLSAIDAQAQTQDAYSADAYNLQAPTTAAITCGDPSTTVTGPSQTSGRHPQADTLDASIHRDLGHGASITAGGFLSAGRDMLVFATSQLSSALDPAYRAQLAENFGVLCPGETLAASDIYVQRYESVPKVTGREWFVDGTIPFGAFRTEVSYETYSLFSPTGAPELQNVVTALVPGAQLAGVPLHRANALLSYSRRRSVVALALQYTSANNAENLPGHVTAALGAQIPFGPGVFAVSAQNLLGSYSGTFVSPRYAVPLGSTGAPIPTLAIPLRPVWSLRYVLSL
jgi:hypothetical protein